jgi:glutathione S-transferase
MLEVLILWRNERERPETARSEKHIAAFQTKIEKALDTLEQEAPDLAASPLNIGAIAVASALSYLDFRFADHDWRSRRSRLAGWYEAFSERPSMRATVPELG